MASATINTIQVEFRGLRPLMFDRYGGDNKTQLRPSDKMYLSSDNHLMMPALNVMSLLAAENTKSVCRQFFGKTGKTVALGIASYVSIDPFQIPILDENGPVKFDGTFGNKISLHRSVARLAKGIPNPKERPTLDIPWRMEFTIKYIPNPNCTLENLRQALEFGGILGLGTFRPYFGRYQLTLFKVMD